MAASKDGVCYVFDLKNRKLLQKLNFKVSPEKKSMLMRDCCFRRDNCIYTLCAQAREPSYIIKWAPSENKWVPNTTQQVYAKSCTSIKIGVCAETPLVVALASDGVVILLDHQTLLPIKASKKLHNMPITCCAFSGKSLITASTDYSYQITALSQFAATKSWSLLLTKLLV